MFGYNRPGLFEGLAASSFPESACSIVYTTTYTKLKIISIRFYLGKKLGRGWEGWKTWSSEPPWQPNGMKQFHTITVHNFLEAINKMQGQMHLFISIGLLLAIIVSSIQLPLTRFC